MNVRDKKGSITIFVLVGLLFMTGFLLISFGSNVNKSKVAKEQFNIMSSIYYNLIEALTLLIQNQNKL